MDRTDPLEKRIENTLRQGVRRLSGVAEKMIPARWGIPDRLVLLPGGRIYLVELKTVTGRTRPAQSVWHRKAAAMGTEVVLLHGEKAVLAWLRDRGQELRKEGHPMLTTRRTQAVRTDDRAAAADPAPGEDLL